MASSGIAAILLPGGRTAYSRFRIPLDIHDGSVYSVSLSSELGELLRRATLVIWDEVPMQHRYCFESVHRMLQDVCSSSALFGGLPFIASRDFTQTLPVVRKGRRPETVHACLQQSFIWPQLRILQLRQNIRVLSGEDNTRFAEWVRTLAAPQASESITIPPWIRVFYNKEDFLRHVYPQPVLTGAHQDPTVLAGRAILAVRNDNVAGINRTLLNTFPSPVTELLAVDTANIEDPTAQDVPPLEVLQSFEPLSLPPSKLYLKVGAPVMLLRNLYPKEGLCNGTRLTITRISPRIVEARILSGEFAGQVKLIPRIKLTSTTGELPFVLSRVQFPIRLSFAITVNKSQGQSLSTVGVDLRYPVFTHGQLYVAFSRVTTLAGFLVLLPTASHIAQAARTVRNIVYLEVLLR